MKVLVTGALGYIGNVVLRTLLQNNVQVLAIDNNKVSAERFLPNWLTYNNFDFKLNDINEIKSTDADIIIHLAAKVGYIQCDLYPDETLHTNIHGLKNIVSLNKPMLFFSTGSVYGSLDTACSEDSPCNPQTLYAKTKLMGESIVNKSTTCIIRPGTAFGLSPQMRHDLLIHNLSRESTKGHLKVYQPYAKRSVYHVQKISDFVLYAINNWHKFQGETINLGSKKSNLTKLEIVQEISKYCNPKIEYIDDYDPDQRDYEVHYGKLKSLWPHSTDQASDHLEKIINYYKAIGSK